MKKLLLAFAIAPLLFASCAKKKITPIPPEVKTVYLDTSKTAATDTSLIITGMKELRTVNWASFTLPLQVTRTKGEQQLISMSISGLPENTEHEWSSPTGYPNFSTNLKLEMNFVKSGTYPVTVAATTASGKSKNYNVNLVVDTMTTKECNAFYNAYASTSFKNRDIAIDSVVYIANSIFHQYNKLHVQDIVLNYDADPTKYYRLLFNTLEEVPVLLVNCEDGTITIPEKVVRGLSWSGNSFKNFTVSGSGKIDLQKGTITINYTTSFDNNGTPAVRTFRLEGTKR